MNNLKNNPDTDIPKTSSLNLSATLQRRSFLKYTGAGAAALFAISAGCTKKSFDQTPYAFPLDFGSGDIALINYAYALEQLEAAFYLTAVASPSFTSIFSAMEQSFLTDIRDHETGHREFLRIALLKQGIAALSFDFSSINFTDRTSVLTAAKSFEDLGVSAYNGCAFLFKDPNYLLIAAKIASVEGRHAAIIGDLLTPGSFANPTTTAGGTLDANSLELSKSPTQVLAIASKFIKSAIVTTNLPTY